MQADNQTKKTLLDSNQYGSLYLYNFDSILFQPKNGKAIFKDFERGMEMSSMKLKGDSLIRLGPSSLLKYSFYTDEFDTLYRSDNIKYYDNLLVKDSLIISYGANVVIFNDNIGKSIFELPGTFFDQNVLLQDSILYLLYSAKSKSNGLYEFNLKRRSKNLRAHFKTENVHYDEKDMNWTGMLLHRDLLFMQFFEKMVVFNLKENRTIAENESLKMDVKLLEQNNQHLVFMNEKGNKIKYDFKKKLFVEL